MNKQYTVTLTLPNGKRKYFRGNTKKEAEAKRDAAKAELAKGVDIGDDSTVAEFAEMWLKDYKEGTVRDVTLRNLRSHVYTYIIPSLGRIKVRDLKPAHVQHMLRELPISKSSQSVVLGTLRSIMEVAVENEIVPRNPCAKSVKPSGDTPKERVPLTADEVTQLVDEAKTTRLYPFVLLALNAGLRRSEVLGMMWSDIDFQKGTVAVCRNLVYTQEGDSLSTDLKSVAAHRTIPIPLSVVSELSKLKEQSKSLYILSAENGAVLTISGFQFQWSSLTARLPFHVHPHLLRHTCITNWFERGLDIKEVQYLAGHSRSSITLDVYTHYNASARLDTTAKKIQVM